MQHVDVKYYINLLKVIQFIHDKSSPHHINQYRETWPIQPDLDLHCLQRQGISGFSRTRINEIVNNQILFNFILAQLRV